MRLIPCNPSDMIYSSVQSCAKNRFVASLITLSLNLFQRALSLQSTVSPKCSPVKSLKRPEQSRPNGLQHTTKLCGPSSRLRRPHPPLITPTLHHLQFLGITFPPLRHCSSRHVYAHVANSDHHPTRTRASFCLHTCVKRCDGRNAMARVEASVSRG